MWSERRRLLILAGIPRFNYTIRVSLLEPEIQGRQEMPKNFCALVMGPDAALEPIAKRNVGGRYR